MAAGCCAVVKPSEVAPKHAALLSELLPKYLDSSAFRVVMGGVPETTKLLEMQHSTSVSCFLHATYLISYILVFYTGHAKSFLSLDVFSSL